MRKKDNSLILTQKIDDVVQGVQDIKDEIATIKKQMETKLSILNTYYATTLSVLNDIGNIEDKTREKDSVVFAIDQDKIVDGYYSSYGQTIHPKLAGLSDQVFNFLTSTGPLFKDNASVTFYYEEETVQDGESTTEDVSDYRYEYCNMLKHETDPTKKDVFKYFPTNHICMAVEIQPANLVGNTSCNMIEICPYLPGTFSIDEIRIWTIDQYFSQQLDSLDANIVTVRSLPNVGQERILLDTTYQIYRIEFDITLQQLENGYPFGLRHLYFYNAKMDTANSYVTVEISKNGYITSLGQSVTIRKPDGTSTYRNGAYTKNDNEIEYYAAFENNTLQGRLQPDTIIARNLTKFYAKIPLFEPICAITFNYIEEETLP